MKTSRAVLALFMGLSLAATAQADQLHDIKAKGNLVCGTFGAIAPFGFPDPKTRETVGIDIDLCKAIAKEMGVNYTVRGFPVGVHIPELNLGHIDVIVANLGYTKARAEQVDYSDAYNVFTEVVVVPTESGITTLDQLAGKKVSATKGSTSEQALRIRVPSATPVGFQDAPAAFLALQQGKVDGFAINNVTAARFVLQSHSMSKPVVMLHEYTYLQPVGVGVKKGEPALLKKVNESLAALEKSGFLEQSWNQWIGSGSELKLGSRVYKVTPIGKLAFQPLP